MNKMEEGLSEWEWSVIKHVKPDVLRKRFREELDHLYSVGPLLDVIQTDFVLAHILSHVWEKTFRLALVCKRFYTVTKSRYYWTLLARKALTRIIPSIILNDINWSFNLDESSPANTWLKALFREDLFHQGFNFILLQTHSTIISDGMEIFWKFDKDAHPHSYCLKYARPFGVGDDAFTYVEYYYFHHPFKRKMIQLQLATSIHIVYCEVFDPTKGQTWYGQPKVRIKKTDGDPVHALTDLLPDSNSKGVWK